MRLWLRPAVLCAACTVPACLILACLACRAASAASAPVQIAAACASCHAAEASAPGQTPGIASLSGMDEAGIAAALRDYRSGRRKGQIMQIVAGALSMAEIDAVSHLVSHGLMR